MIDARLYFDRYLVSHSTPTELVEVLRYTYVFGSRCLGRVLRATPPPQPQQGALLDR